MCEYLRNIQIVSLLLLTEAAVLCDLSNGRIPNELVLGGLGMGLIYQAVLSGLMGVVLCFGGILLPVLLFGPLYYFRMIGAGDIKLMGVVGAFVGPAACFSCILWSLIAGGIISLMLVLYHHNFILRIFSFTEYVGEYMRTGVWKAYLDRVDERGRFCFSIPVLVSVLCYIGGII